jgi:hypothetical protein
VIRGCMFDCDSKRATATLRRPWPATDGGFVVPVDYGDMGFRCAKDAAN